MNISNSYCLRVSIGHVLLRPVPAKEPSKSSTKSIRRAREAVRTKPKHGESFYFSSLRWSTPQKPFHEPERNHAPIVLLGGGHHLMESSMSIKKLLVNT